MRKLLFLYLILSFGIGYSQIEFEKNILFDDYNTLVNIISISIADFNGDGIEDIASASIGDNTIAWFQNDGFGNFSNKKIISLSSKKTNTLIANDIDNDGDMDLVSISPRNGLLGLQSTLSWYENLDGLGNFGNQHIILISSVFSVGKISVDDLNNDGFDDISVIINTDGFGTDLIIWYKNDGFGNFIFQQIIVDDLHSPVQIFTYDIDNDNDMDILFLHSGGYVNWYENMDGNGTFSELHSISINIGDSKQIYLSDIDNDGDFDIIARATSIFSNKVAWFENIDGQGTYGSPNYIENNTIHPKTLYANDVDGDGDMDIVFDSKKDSSQGPYPHIFWFENLDGSGSFSSEKLIYSIHSTHSPSNKYNMFDVDNDGKLDLICSNFRYISWMKNINNDGSFGLNNFIISNKSINKSVPTDIDGDGDVDILTCLDSFDKIVWFENDDGQGNFNPYKTIDIHVGIKDVYSYDIDGDNDMDILAVSDKLYWYENLGFSNFGEMQFINDHGVTSSYYVVDFDNDGDLDILITDYRKVFWIENLDGLGNYSSMKLIFEDEFPGTQATYYNDVCASDIDNDGDLDVFTAAYYKDISWFENFNNSNFSLRNLIESDSQSIGRVVINTDIDNDGFIDLLVGLSNNNGRISWYKNTNGSVGDNHIIDSDNISDNINGLDSIVVIDVDNDGDNDVFASVLPDDNNLCWYENMDGLGTFSLQNIIDDNLYGPSNILSADFNGDGKSDLLLSTYPDIIWYKNTSIINVKESTQIDFTIYPNPTENTINITSRASINNIKIYNKLGQLVLINSTEIKIDISNLTQGLYFVKVEDENGNFGIKKMVKI